MPNVFQIVALVAVFSASFLYPTLTGAQSFETKAAQAFMIDAETGTVLFSKKPDEPFPPASLAKLMTVELAFRALKDGELSLQDEFTISENAWRTGGAPSGTATMFAEVNSAVPLEALLKAIIVQSANDGSIAVAESMAGSEEGFARRMTDRARDLGLDVSTFRNSTGLPADGQHITSREITMLALHLWREYPAYYHYFNLPGFEWNGIFQRNRNPLLEMDIGADGLKTGHTEASGYAIVASARRDGRRLFATLAGMASAAERAEEARKMLDWGMRAFDSREVAGADEIIGVARVYGGEKDHVSLRTEKTLRILVPNTNSNSVSARIVYHGPIPAPIEEGAQIGSLRIEMAGDLSREVPLYAAEPVELGTIRQRAMGAVRELAVGWMR